MKYRVALVGNPNCGKTTLFNELTKMHQTVGNWTGVTIEKKEGLYHKNKDVIITDLPGIYSLTPYSLEEVITRNYILDQPPDIIINIIDSTNLERNLYLTTQLMEFNCKVIIALNMEDELAKNGISIDSERLSILFGVKVVSISALKKQNIDKLMTLTIAECSNIQRKKPIPLPQDINKVLDDIAVSADIDIKERWTLIKLFEKDKLLLEKLSDSDIHKIENIIKPVELRANEKSSEIISNLRYRFLEKNIKNIEYKGESKSKETTDKIDNVLLNKYAAFPLFILIIFVMYMVSIQLIGGLCSDGLEYLFFDVIGENLRFALTNAGVSEWLISLLADGIIRGVGTVLTFIPQILALFLFISILEACGYMARVAFIMDKLFRKIGLSGKSFIPMIVGCGCSVPAIMTARTIENNDERRLTIMLTPFIPCSAKLPVFALIVGTFFPNNPFVAPSMYLLGIIMVILSGLILKRLKIFKSSDDTFVLELPPYRLPKVKNIALQLWDKLKSFLIKAGTIILTASVIMWFLQSFNWKLQMVETQYSILASIGTFLAPIFAPLGFGKWQAVAAIITGIFAKEAVVSTLSILMGESIAALFSSSAAAYAFMSFILLASPCVAALSATKKEMGSVKWLFIAILFQTVTAYIVSMLIYFIGNLFLLYKGIFLTVLISILVIAALIIALISIYKNKKKCGCNCASCGKNCNGRNK